MGAKGGPITVNTICRHPRYRPDAVRLEGLVRRVCRKCDCTSAEVSIAVVGDDEMRLANRHFLHRAGTTDVISFDLSEGHARDIEMLVNAEEAMRQAGRRGHSVDAEVALYVVHGLLHQLGFDDTDAKEARRMHAAEDALLRESGFGVVYARRRRERATAARPLRKG